MIKVIILKGRIEKRLWLKVILVIIYIKNLQPIWVLKESISSIKKQDNTFFSL